jgi:hypothetical protein
MGCGCGKSKRSFARRVKQAKALQEAQAKQEQLKQNSNVIARPMSRAERIENRRKRIEARDARIKARNARMLAERAKQQPPPVI